MRMPMFTPHRLGSFNEIDPKAKCLFFLVEGGAKETLELHGSRGREESAPHLAHKVCKELAALEDAANSVEHNRVGRPHDKHVEESVGHRAVDEASVGGELTNDAAVANGLDGRADNPQGGGAGTRKNNARNELVEAVEVLNRVLLRGGSGGGGGGGSSSRLPLGGRGGKAASHRVRVGGGDGRLSASHAAGGVLSDGGPSEHFR